MRLALLNSLRILPAPATRGAVCPFCLVPVIARCGTVRAWHWAHAEGNCDSWLAPDTEWTNEWKSHFPQDCTEVLRAGRVADIALSDRVLELVQLGLTPTQIEEREAAFTPMAWVVDAHSARIELEPDPDGFVRFTWPRPRTNWLHAAQPVVLDLGSEILHVKKMRTNRSGAIRGWGYHYPKPTFLDLLVCP